MFKKVYFIIILFIYIPNVAFHPGPPSQSSLLFSLWEGALPQASTFSGASNLYRIRLVPPTKARQSRPLLHMCNRGVWVGRVECVSRTSSCMIFGRWLSLWELPGSRLEDTGGLPMGLPSPLIPSICPLTLPQGPPTSKILFLKGHDYNTMSWSFYLDSVLAKRPRVIDHQILNI